MRVGRGLLPEVPAQLITPRFLTVGAFIRTVLCSSILEYFFGGSMLIRLSRTPQTLYRYVSF